MRVFMDKWFLNKAGFPFMLIVAMGLMTSMLARDSLKYVQDNKASNATAQREPDVRLIEAGKPIERELKGGETHVYSVALTAGQLLHVVVDQRGIDVVVALFGPD